MADIWDGMTFLVGTEDILNEMPKVEAWEPFDGRIVDFFDSVSAKLMKDQQARMFADVVTLAFWLRRASLFKLRGRFMDGCGGGKIRTGRGVAFHIAPSNVPVNYAYSLAAGLLAGNVNIVRAPSASFLQVDIISRAMMDVLGETGDACGIRSRLCVVRYGHSKEINDALSGMADVRVVWGGDGTVAELRTSPLPPRSTEVTFADRFSIAVIDAQMYMDAEDRDALADAFYNDTYLMDQNACTSPRLVVWLGRRKEEAKALFWELLHEKVKAKYDFRDIQGINKLADAYRCAAGLEGVRLCFGEDMLLVRAGISELSENLMEYRGNSGFFFAYDCEDIMELRCICDDRRCQTLAYFGDKKMLGPLLVSGIHGVDRVVPIGRTMEFDLVWDGMDLVERLSRYMCVC